MLISPVTYMLHLSDPKIQLNIIMSSVAALRHQHLDIQQTLLRSTLNYPVTTVYATSWF